MSTAAFDAFTRRAAEGVSRRGSLMTLGGAGLAAALGGPLTADAKKGKKKGKRTCKNPCEKQVGRCRAFVSEVCREDENDTPEEIQECEDRLLPCCEFLSNCNWRESIECLTEPN